MSRKSTIFWVNAPEIRDLQAAGLLPESAGSSTAHFCGGFICVENVRFPRPAGC